MRVWGFRGFKRLEGLGIKAEGFGDQGLGFVGVRF